MHLVEDNNTSTEPYSIDELQEKAYCTSDIFLSDSFLPMAGDETQSRHAAGTTLTNHLSVTGKGLFARRAFKAGDIISISPVVLLPLDEVAETFDESILVNFCIYSEQSNVVLFPLGLVGMCYNLFQQHDANDLVSNAK
jgi:hypothetical protein